MKHAASTRPRARLFLSAFIGVALVLVGVQTAFSKPGLAAPTITNKPAAATTSTSATFTFTGPSGATFKCSLDSSTFTACVSPKSYSALAQGTHTFAVKSVKGAAESSATSYTWTVDTTAPAAPTLTSKPAALSNIANPSFAFSGPESGLSYRCDLDGGAQAACTSPKSYSGLSQAAHTFRVRAVDAAGNVGAPTSYTWTIDTTAPQAPTLTVKPDNPTSNATNFFQWTGAESGLTYECSLENGSFAACVTPYTWVINTSNYGQHQFAVRALDAAGNRSAATQYVFKYEKKLPTSGIPFNITGSADGLTIGLWRPIQVTISNPNSVTIFVSALNVAVAADSTPPGCLSGPNIELQQANVTPTQMVSVPANGQVTLPAQGVNRPQIRLKNLPNVNQDVCKNKSFALSLSGTATN
jgi:hypothetical protein